MTTTVAETVGNGRPSNYLNASYGIKSWLLTMDHKRVGILYLVVLTMFFLIGGLFASLIRLELLTPEGDLVEAETFNKLFTMHGVAMIFFFLIPSVPAVLGNFCIPLQIGARDVAFPKINLTSWYCYVAGGSFATLAIIMGGVDTGWTFYTPIQQHLLQLLRDSRIGWRVHQRFLVDPDGGQLSHHRSQDARPRNDVVPPAAVHLGAVRNQPDHGPGNPGGGDHPPASRPGAGFGIGIFDPALGGDPVLFQHMFWFYSHPAVYIMIVPGFGVISDVIACFCRKRVFGYSFVAFSSLAIAVLGFLVWGHHMFTTGQSLYAGMVFSFITFLIAVPTAVKIFNWTATMYRGSVSLESPMLYALGFIGLFLIGGLTGLFLSTLGTDIHLHDTYFIVAHFHYVMVGGMVMAFMSGLHFWWPKITGRMYSEVWGKTGAVLIFAGFNFTFFPQFVLGYLGMPRRYHVYPEEWQILHVMSTAGASVLAVGYAVMMMALVWSLFRGRRAGANPWKAKGLEWELLASPPPAHNFEKTPVVTSEAYAYEEEDVTLAEPGQVGVPKETAQP